MAAASVVLATGVSRVAGRAIFLMTKTLTELPGGARFANRASAENPGSRCAWRFYILKVFDTPLEILRFFGDIDVEDQGITVTWNEPVLFSMWFYCRVLVHELGHHFAEQYAHKNGVIQNRKGHELIAELTSQRFTEKFFASGTGRKVQSPESPESPIEAGYAPGRSSGAPSAAARVTAAHPEPRRRPRPDRHPATRRRPPPPSAAGSPDGSRYSPCGRCGTSWS